MRTQIITGSKAVLYISCDFPSHTISAPSKLRACVRNQVFEKRAHTHILMVNVMKKQFSRVIAQILHFP